MANKQKRSKTTQKKRVRPEGFEKHPERINRKGRPKLGLSLAELLRQKGESGDNETIATAIVKKAKMGDIAAAKLYWDRAYGQAPATVELSANIHSATVEAIMEHTRDWLLKRHPAEVADYLEYMAKCQK